MSHGTLTVYAQSPEQPQPGPEHKQLEVWLGEWNYEGVGKESPFYPPGAASKFAGKQTGRMILDGFFLESRWEDKGESGYIAQGLMITGYDPKTRTYVDYGFENDGTAGGTGSTTVTDHTWTSLWSRTGRDGNVYKVKFRSTFSADGRTVESTQEYSKDDGRTWMTFLEFTMRKAGE
jgi:hypothetical protein